MKSWLAHLRLCFWMFNGIEKNICSIGWQIRKNFPICSLVIVFSKSTTISRVGVLLPLGSLSLNFNSNKDLFKFFIYDPKVFCLTVRNLALCPLKIIHGNSPIAKPNFPKSRCFSRKLLYSLCRGKIYCRFYYQQKLTLLLTMWKYCPSCQSIFITFT